MTNRIVEDNAIYIRINPKEICFLDKILEGFDGLGILSTLDGKTGDAIVRVTPDTKAEVLKIIESMPNDIEILDVT